MQAVIKTGGKQYIVKQGDELLIELVGQEDGTDLTLDVLAIMDGSNSKVGTPTVPGASVTAKVLSTEKGEKIHIFKFKPKKHIRKRKGHRQKYSLVKVTAVSAG